MDNGQAATSTTTTISTTGRCGYTSSAPATPPPSSSLPSHGTLPLPVAASTHSQVEGMTHSGPKKMVLYFTGATNILYTFGGSFLSVLCIAITGFQQYVHIPRITAKAIIDDAAAYDKGCFWTPIQMHCAQPRVSE
ncbi:unnamed protein product [Urochloa humidicola]